MTRLRLSTALLVAAASALTTTGVLAESEPAPSSSEFCPTMAADLHRRQLAQFANETFVYKDGSSAKHIPFLTMSEDGLTGTVVVGNGDEDGGVYHPMVASGDPATVHWITHILVKDQDGKVVALEAMDPTSEAPAKMTFAVPAGATELTPLEWCNKHGLYAGAAVTIPAATAERTTKECALSAFDEPSWESIHADFVRQQAAPPFSSDVPFDEGPDKKGAKHTPYITLSDDGKTASILVGDPASAIHPMKGSLDAEGDPHWITEVYVTDGEGKIVAMKTFDTTGVDKATMEFDVPDGAVKLKAYAWCNLHGLWEGPEVEVTAATMEDGESSGVVRSVGVGAVAAASLVAALA